MKKTTSSDSRRKTPGARRMHSEHRTARAVRALDHYQANLFKLFARAGIK